MLTCLKNRLQVFLTDSLYLGVIGVVVDYSGQSAVVKIKIPIIILILIDAHYN